MKRNATSTTGLSQASAGADTSVGRGCLNKSRKDATGSLARRMSCHRPGSALILVLVCLVMMVLIGTAYIQVARVDRRATAQLTGVNNLDTVRDAVIAYVAKVLKEDIFDDAGKMFSAAGFDESYDYPFTNRDASFAVVSGSPNPTPGLGASLGSAVGGRFDDTWLASTYTDVESRLYPAWSHISNLNGIFLNLPLTGGTLKYPEELVVSSQTVNPRSPAGALRLDGYGETFWSGADNYDYAVHTMPSQAAPGNANSLDFIPASYQKTGVDTDGDGILDSRWTWAPEEVRQIGALTYVVAYRIIDLSSMVNINVATAATANGSTVPGFNLAPRGHSPSDLDLTRLLSKARNANAAWSSELQSSATSVFNIRGLTGAALPMLPGIATFNATSGLAEYNWTTNLASRASAWENPSIGAKYYGYANNRFSEDSELELRARGGLNTATVAPIENSLPVMLRRDNLATNEVNYASAALGVTGTGDRIVHSYMAGSPNSPNEGTGFFHAGRTLPEIRHMMTTMSGASILAPQYPGMSAVVGNLDRLQYDLVNRNVKTSNPAARAQEIADRLKKILKIGTPMYLGLANAAEVDKIATEFAIAIQDYSDADSTPAALALGGTTYYGLEIMPFLREFYVQAAYESTMPDTAAMPPVYKERTLVPGSGAFVIEIGNPFDKNCSFAGSGSGVSLRVRILKEGSGTALVQYDVPTTVQELPPRDNNEVTEQLIFYSTPGTPVTDGLGKGADMVADLALTTAYPNGARRIEISTKLPDGAFDDSPLTVELQVEVSSGTFITYDRLRSPDMKLPNKYTQDHGDATTPEKGHAQISLMRDGQKTRYLSNRGRAVAKSNAAKDSYVNNGSLSKIGSDNKSIVGDTNLDKIQLAHSDHQIFNVAELGYIFMYGFFDGDEGDLPSRFSGKDGSKGTGVTTDPLDTACPARHFLSLTANGAIPGTVVVPTATRIPHFSMVMDQFTTLSPRWDGLDNDNDDGDNNLGSSADNEEEQFVPGLQNVNTMPAWLMGLTSPLPETTAEIETFYQAIAEYRDFPVHRQKITGEVTGLRTDYEADKGIASIGEILLIKGRRGSGSGDAGGAAGTANAATITAASQARRYGEDNAALLTTNPLKQYPHADSDAVVYEGEEYPAQERMSRFQYLANTLTTRSDRYCAYILIRGYNSTDFSAAPAESLNFFVLLDRSKLLDLDSPVVVHPRTGQKN